MANIAFIGLGNMGAPMAINLAKAGHQVRAFDLSREAVAKVVAEGGSAATSAQEAVEGAEVVVSMLPASQHVEGLFLGNGSQAGLLQGIAKGALIIDSSTIAAATSQKVAKAAQALGIGFIDAPVSGGTGGAIAGSLTFMVGGSAADLERARPLLEKMGRNIFHAGDVGAGQTAKICNNMLLGISMIGTCEAIALAEKLGLDPERFFEIASKSSGQCWSVSNYYPWPGPVPTAPSNRNYEGGFATAMMLKDLKLAQDAAAKAGASTPLAAQAEALYALFNNLGNGQKDFSAMLEMLRGTS